ncbi:MAG: CbiQ family ECF transporter T component [Candidatus Eisenbacteria bacterium]
MIGTLAQMDLLANAGRSPWHAASARSKLLLAAGLVLLAVLAPSRTLLGALFALALTLALSGRLPLRLVMLAAGYPLIFVALFVISHWDGTWATPARLILRPLTCSLTAVWLMGTTPYPDVFAPLSRILPRGIGDALFLTYRALFELLGRLERLWLALRLRGGTRGSVRQRFSHVGEGLGTLVLYGFERSQRVYAAMQLRGHNGRICGCRHYAEGSHADVLVGCAGAAALAAALLLWRTP